MCGLDEDDVCGCCGCVGGGFGLVGVMCEWGIVLGVFARVDGIEIVWYRRDVFVIVGGCG